MEGAARAANRRADENTVLAYRALQFYGLATKGKLKLSDHLIEKPKPAPKPPQTAEQMLAILQGMAGRGAPMNIRRVN